jgi:hypothetical protein
MSELLFNDSYSQPRLLYLGMFAVVYIVTAFFMYRRLLERHRTRSKEFFNDLITGILDKTINTQSDLIHFYQGTRNFGSDDYKQSLTRLLREAFAKVVSKKTHSDLSPEDRIQLAQILSNFIFENEKLTPYADLPNTERNLIKDIELYAKRYRALCKKRRCIFCRKKDRRVEWCYNDEI